MDKDWHPPGEIRFTRRQSLWLVQSLVTLEEGHWPTDASSYIDIPGKKGKSGRAPFATPIEYAAEITDRLERCGIDGLILLAMECWGMNPEPLSRYFQKPVWSIWKRRKNALGYISSGPSRRWHAARKRKAESYHDYKERTK